VALFEQNKVLLIKFGATQAGEFLNFGVWGIGQHQGNEVTKGDFGHVGAFVVESGAVFVKGGLTGYREQFGLHRVREWLWQCACGGFHVDPLPTSSPVRAESW